MNENFKGYFSFNNQLFSSNHQPTLPLNNHHSQLVSQEHELNLFQSECNSKLSSNYLSELGDNQLKKFSSQLLPVDSQTNLFSPEYSAQFSFGYQSELSSIQPEQISLQPFLHDNQTNLFSFENDSQLPPYYHSELSDNQFDNQSNLNLHKYNSQHSIHNQFKVQQFSPCSTPIQLEENIQQSPFDNKTNLFSLAYNSQPFISYDLDDSFLSESLIYEDKSQLLIPENYPELPSPKNKSQSSSGYEPDSAHIPSKPFSCTYESQVHSTNSWSQSEVSHSEILYNKKPFKSYDEPHPVSSIEDQNINKFEKFIKNSNVLCYDEDDIQTYLKSNNNKKKILNAEKYLKLIKKTKPLLRFDLLTIQMLEEMTDKFVESVMNGACQFAKHRKGNTVIMGDVKLYLENVLNIKAPPGYFGFEIQKYKKSVVTEKHKARLALINKTMKKKKK